MPCTVVVVPSPSEMVALPPLKAKAPTPRFLEPLFGAVSLTVIAPPVPKVTEAVSPLASAPIAELGPEPPSVTVMISLSPARMVAFLPAASASA